MITEFRIRADTKSMTVTLNVYQSNKLQWSKQYPTVTAACEAIGQGIAIVGAKRDRPPWED